MAHRIIRIVVLAILAVGCGSTTSTFSQKGPNGAYDRTTVEKPLGGSSVDTKIDTTQGYKSCMDAYGHDARAEAYCRSQTSVPLPGQLQSLPPGASLYTPAMPPPSMTFPYQGRSNPPSEVVTPGQLAAAQSGGYYTLAPQAPPMTSAEGPFWTAEDARVVGSTLKRHAGRLDKLEKKPRATPAPAKR